MKTIALTLFAAALGFAQNSTSPGTTPATAPASTPGSAPARTPGQRAAAQRAAQNAAQNAVQNKKPAQPSKPSPDQKMKAHSPAPSIPAGATLVEPDLYRYTDSSGKTWNYRQTPFGITKWEEGSAPASQLNPQVHSEPVTITDLGDSYRFQRKTPFGESNWIRKKSELTDEEKALTVDRQTQTVAPATSIASKPVGNP